MRSGEWQVRKSSIIVLEIKNKTMAKKNWVSKAIKHPGRCKDMGSKECPKGSPQYNLALRFKKGGDLHKQKKS